MAVGEKGGQVTAPRCARHMREWRKIGPAILRHSKPAQLRGQFAVKIVAPEGLYFTVT
jgi:hypothetical protein